jgi:hypothetical protein
MTTKDYTQTINGVKFNVHEDSYGGQTNQYFTSEEGLEFKRYNTDRTTLVTSGTAYGHKGIETLKKVFPNMETKRHMGASDDDGTPDDFPIVDFYKSSQY